MRVLRGVVVVGLSLVALLDPPPAEAKEVKATPTGLIAHDARVVVSTKTVGEFLTTLRADVGHPGKLVAGAGYRPAISMVRTVGASTCRTSGIVPPLGAGHFGEPGIGGLGLCPSAPGQPATAPPPPTPLEAAYYAWLFIVDMPSPTASTQPTIGITGLDTFLSIGGQQGMVLDVPALGYNVHFDISSVYDIDWGDPRPDGTSTGAAVTRNHHDQGGPYPNGTLRHKYIQRGAATITITQRWSANWSAGAEGGSLPDSVETDGTLSLPVQEIQAVVTG